MNSLLMKMKEFGKALAAALIIFLWRQAYGDTVDSTTGAAKNTRIQFCSNNRPDICLTIVNKSFPSETTEDICSGLDGVAVDMRNESILYEVMSIAAGNTSNHSLFINARRSTYFERIRGKQIQVEPHVLMKGYLSWYKKEEAWSQKHHPLCQYKNCSGFTWCYFVGTVKYNWFDSRTKCLSMSGDLIGDFDEAKKLGVINKYNDYWLAISNLKWTWIDLFGEVRYLPDSPKWSKLHPEDLTTECATVNPLSCSMFPCLEWQARDCNEEIEMAIVCQFAHSQELLISENSQIEKTWLTATLVILLIVIISAIVVLIILRKSRLVEKCADNVSKKHKMSKCSVRSSQRSQLNYPDLCITAARELSAAPLYENCNDPMPLHDMEHVYTNVQDMASDQKSAYCLSRGFQEDQPRSSWPTVSTSPSLCPTSPVVVVDNGLYEEVKDKKKKGLSINILSTFVRKNFKKSCDDDAGESGSSYEPLSPVSFGRRSAASGEVCCQVGTVDPERDLLEKNDYTRLSHSTSSCCD